MKLAELYNTSKELLNKYGNLDVGVLLLKPWEFYKCSKFPDITLEYIDKSIAKDYIGKPFINLYVDNFNN